MPMIARSPREAHRAATPLELFFDLVFVVAIARAAAGLHHAIGDNHVAHGLAGFVLVFFAIWWAWMNFTWFASAYDCDDTAYRLATFVQVTGALVLAAGVPDMFETGRPTGAVLAGYVIMRLGLVSQWLRAAAADEARRRTALRYAGGISLLQVAWVGMLALPPGWTWPVFLVLAALEMGVPAWAERAAQTPWHPHHIAERYGLLTIIVLGESVLACTIAVDQALTTGTALATLLPLIAGALLTLYSMWWIYFHQPVHDLLTSPRRVFVWGYGHYVVFGAAAAVGAGLAVSADVATGHGAIGATGAGLAVTIPVSVYLTVLWLLHDRPGHGRTRWVTPVAVPVILLTSLTSQAVLLTGLTLAGVVAMKILTARRV